MSIEENLVDYTYFIEELMEYLKNNYSLSEFGFNKDDAEKNENDDDDIDDDDIEEKELQEFIEEVKTNQYSKKTKERLTLIEDFISSVDGDEQEVIESPEGYIFVLSKLGPLISLSYEGDGYSYFKREEDAYEFIEEW